MTCADCADDLSHCHGTLLLPDGLLGTAECTDPSCVDLAAARHPLVLAEHDPLPQATEDFLAA
ncbi:hypothetical protein [Actinokineospora terrae]|uniref:Uncharacterized protein n=1 Tax=Actinokineospora terrae TaxID=155974 RepID=A0A1H9TUQ9_9PSEU|nr:hypothetical protein [Actinokineospora terrae]SES00751.1 hypothetical protein SAMN04487818_106481 [Actinokineospora terrae]